MSLDDTFDELPELDLLVLGDLFLENVFEDKQNKYNEENEFKIERRAAWKPAEDRMLRFCVSKYGTKWSQISAQMSGRSADALRNRWLRLSGLSPLPTHKQKGGPRIHWSSEEDAQLRAILRTSGSQPNWVQIANALNSNRKAGAVKNRALRLVRKLSFKFHLKSFFAHRPFGGAASSKHNKPPHLHRLLGRLF